ncbi:Uncharacterized [Moorella glycerini]|uniref:Uncharacterized protein n=1 Tax=Neomoorella stamsii TaxID=1266720 RepID=A0A9X7J6D4_9FIRM|nr:MULTISPECIES: hypothetical protein [Moorella]PRR77448.1 hypothetical protein MOST_01980 [Moorella stamsii]CEP68197.1 Uncharacterized [Moorella glycerini]
MTGKAKKKKKYERLEERLSQDPRTRAQYLSRMKWKMDYLSALKTAESRGRTEGKIEGKIDIMEGPAPQ